MFIYLLTYIDVTGILARVTEADKTDMQKLGYEYIRLVKSTFLTGHLAQRSVDVVALGRFLRDTGRSGCISEKVNNCSPNRLEGEQWS